MRFYVVTLLYWLLPLLVACGETKQAPPPFVSSGRVISIADGDTFTVLTAGKTQIKVRLFGIDAPEKKQPYGTVARQALADLVFGKEVSLQEKDRDRYGRTVAIAFTPDGRNINEVLLQLGTVWQYTGYSNSSRWAALEADARKNKRGLWADSRPVPPWQWRKEKRTSATLQ